MTLCTPNQITNAWHCLQQLCDLEMAVFEHLWGMGWEYEGGGPQPKQPKQTNKQNLYLYLPPPHLFSPAVCVCLQRGGPGPQRDILILSEA